jgi:hypothetical protein
VVYWCAVSLLAWLVLGFFGMFWYPLHASSAATICLAVAFGCVANWRKNRTLHCGIPGPVFAIAGALFLLAEMRFVGIDPRMVWLVVAIVSSFSFLLEWYATRT